MWIFSRSRFSSPRMCFSPCMYVHKSWKKGLIKQLLISLHLQYVCLRHQGRRWCIDLFPGSLFSKPPPLHSAIIKAPWTKMAATAGCAPECLSCTTCRALRTGSVASPIWSLLLTQQHLSHYHTEPLSHRSALVLDLTGRTGERL